MVTIWKEALVNFKTPLEKQEPVMEKDQEKEKHPWWDGRQVAIRPDVPGPSFDPGDLVLVETENERTEMNVRIDESVDEDAQAARDDLWPDWLAPKGGESDKLSLDNID